MKEKQSIIELLMKYIIKHAKFVISLLICITLFFAYQMKDIKIDTNIFAFASIADKNEYKLTPEAKPSTPLYLKHIGDIDVMPDKGEVVLFTKDGNSFSSEEFTNPIEYVQKEVEEYVWPTGRNDNTEFYDGFVIVFTSEKMFTTEVLNAIYDVREQLSKRWEIGPCLSPFDYVTVEKKGTRLSIVPIAPVKAVDGWCDEDVEIFKTRLMNDSVAKDYLYSSDGTTIMIYYRARGLNSQSIAELDAIVNPLRQYGRVALNGGGLLTNAVYNYINIDLITLLALCLVVILIIFYLSFRTLKSLIIPATLSIMGVIWTLGLMAMLGYRLTIVTVLTPCLVLTFGSSYAIHMISEYFKALELDEKDKLPYHYAKISKTILFAMMTTVSGFLSQLICTLDMFKQFGLTISFGVFFCSILAFTYIPSILSLVKAPKAKKIEKLKTGYLARFIKRVAKYTEKYYFVVLILFIILVTVFFFIKDDLGFDSNYMSYFPKNDPIVKDTIYFAKTLGGTDPYYVTIVAPDNEKGFFLKSENLHLVYAYEQAVLAADPDLVQSLSFSQYVSFLNEIYNNEKGIPNNSGLINFLSRTLKQIKNQLDADVLNSLINDDGSQITLAMRHYDYVEQDIQTNASAKRIEDTLDYYRYMLPSGTKSLIYSGASSGLRASDIIINDQNKATFISIALILIFASLACSSIFLGLAALIPVLTAVMINYVFMWLFNIPFDMITIGFASVAIGAGVDDAIHFLLRFKNRRNNNANEKYLVSVKQTILDTGRPIILTTVSVDAGLIVLLFASFNPIKYFGVLMCLALTAAMISTLLVLPAFLILFDKIRCFFIKEK